MSQLKVADMLRRAEEALNQGSLSRVRRLLKPLIEAGDSDALFLDAHFSARQESILEFEARRIRILLTLVQQGHARACYAMARHYEFGDLVDRNLEASAALDRQASEAGYGAAKLAHGLNLYYGSYGVEQNRPVAIQWIESAMRDGVEGAQDTMREILSGKPESRSS